jgi:hypothetical protein
LLANAPSGDLLHVGVMYIGKELPDERPVAHWPCEESCSAGCIGTSDSGMQYRSTVILLNRQLDRTERYDISH